MLLVRLAIKPEVQGLKLAVDIFSFVTNFYSPHVRVPKVRSYETRSQPARRAGTRASVTIMHCYKLMILHKTLLIMCLIPSHWNTEKLAQLLSSTYLHVDL